MVLIKNFQDSLYDLIFNIYGLFVNITQCLVLIIKIEIHSFMKIQSQFVIDFVVIKIIIQLLMVVYKDCTIVSFFFL